MGAVTSEQIWLMNQLLDLEDGTANGGQLAWKKGYHSTEEYNREYFPGNYSIRDAIDREGPDDKCAAFDWTFRDAQKQNYKTIAKYMKRIRASGKNPADPRLDGWREFYGQADEDDYIEGYDTRYDKEVTSDASHLWHIHGSETRKFVLSLRNKQNLLSVLKGETVQQWRDGGGKSVWEDTGGTKPSVPVTQPPIKGDAPGDPIAFPLPSGYYFGPKNGGNESVSGFYGRKFKGRTDREWLQEWTRQLQRRGWSIGKGKTYLSGAGNDGKFGPEYAKLVRAFQKDQRLEQDEKLGKRTWNAAFLNPVT